MTMFMHSTTYNEIFYYFNNHPLQLDDSERGKAHIEELLSAEQEKVQLHVQECDNLRESRETLDKKLDQMQRRLHRVGAYYL